MQQHPGTRATHRARHPGPNRICAPGPATHRQSPQDQALALLRAGKWPEAAAAARQALAQEPNSSAAHFNLGRALLGAGAPAEAAAELAAASTLTGGTNADVEFYRGQAEAQAGHAAAAAAIYQAALSKVPGDAEIAAALAELQRQHPELAVRVLEADLDGDGQPDRITLDGTKLTVASSAGAQPFERTFGAPPQVEVIPIPAGLPILHVAHGACGGAGPEHLLVAYAAGAKALLAYKTDRPCSAWATVAPGQFQLTYRGELVWMVAETVRWQSGQLVTEGEVRQTLIPSLVSPQMLPAVLQTYWSRKVDGMAGLFATPTMFADFQAQTSRDGTWSAGAPEIASGIAKVPLLRNGKPAGQITFSPEKHLVVDLQWINP